MEKKKSGSVPNPSVDMCNQGGNAQGVDWLIEAFRQIYWRGGWRFKKCCSSNNIVYWKGLVCSFTFSLCLYMDLKQGQIIFRLKLTGSRCFYLEWHELGTWGARFESEPHIMIWYVCLLRLLLNHIIMHNLYKGKSGFKFSVQIVIKVFVCLEPSVIWSGFSILPAFPLMESYAWVRAGFDALENLKAQFFP